MRSPRPAGGVSFDRIAARYDETRGSHGHADVTTAAIEPWLVPYRRVVEVGVGTGLIAAELIGRGWDVVGFDLSARMLETARERTGGRVALGDAQALPVRDNSVGSVYYSHVLHLVSDVAATLAEAARIIEPAGRVVVVCRGERSRDDTPATLIAGVERQLSGPRTDIPERVVEAAAASGLTLAHRQLLAHHLRISPADIAANLEQRVWSWTWDVDDARWSREVGPVIEQLRSMPDADRPCARMHERTLLTFDAAGTAA